MWKTVKLGDVCEFENGDRGKNYPSKKHQVEKGIPFINAGDLSNDGKITSGGMSYITNERFELLGAGKIKINDILFCLRGSLGKCAINKSFDKGAIASSLVIMRADKRELIPEFLLYFLRSQWTAKLIRETAGGAAQPNLSAKVVSDYELFIPPIAEQQRIVAKLDAAFAEIDKAISMSEQQAIKASDYGYLIIKSTIKELINKYGKCSISDIAIIQPHKKISLKRLNENDEVSFMGMNSLGIEKKYSEPEFNKTLKEAYKAYQYFENGDVIFAKITPCFENGKLSIAKNLTNGVGFGSSEFVVLRTNANFNSEFLYYCLLNKIFRKNGEKNMSGAVGHKRVSKEYFHNYTIPLPPLDVQQLEIKKFDEVWENTKNIISTQNKKVKELIKLKSAILSQELKFEAA